MDNNILTEKELSNSAYSHIIHAPIEKVDIAAWLFTLPEAEYCRCCPPDHISCAATTDDGKKMSIKCRNDREDAHDSALCCGDSNRLALPNGLDFRRIYAKRAHSRAGDLDS